jgi:hypothetical protein
MLRSNPQAATGRRIGAIVSMVAVTIVLVLPVLRTYHFSRSYKPIEAQSAVRHWSLDFNEERAVRSIDQVANTPSFTHLVTIMVPMPALRPEVSVSAPISIPHWLARLRLGASRTSDPPLPG